METTGLDVTATTDLIDGLVPVVMSVGGAVVGVVVAVYVFKLIRRML